VKHWRTIVLGLLVLAGVYYVYLHHREWGLFGSRTAESEESATSGLGSLYARPARVSWQSVDRSPDGFKVDMPSQIKEMHVPAYAEKGAAEQVEMIYSNPDPETTYAVSWADNPPVTRTADRSPEHILDLARDDAMASTQTTLVNESHGNPAGYPQRDFSARNSGGGVMKCRLIYAGQRLYMLTAAFPSAQARNDQDVARFFNSFALTESSRIPESLPAAPPPSRN
jgi:hypothetical protein